MKLVLFSPQCDRLGRPMSQGKMALNISWLAESVRFSWFGAEKLVPAAEIWTSLRAQEPEDQSSQAGGAVSQASGALENGTLLVSVAPGRADIHIIPQMAVDLAVLGLKTVGPADEAMRSLRDLVGVFLRQYRPTNRLAYGMVFSAREETREAAFTTMGRALPDLRSISPEVEDFLFQVNRPRVVTLNDRDVRINRLSKWQAASRRLVVAQQGVPGAGFQTQIPTDDHMVRLELDINTSPAIDHLFSPDDVRGIEPLLFDMSREIASEGDLP